MASIRTRLPGLAHRDQHDAADNKRDLGPLARGVARAAQDDGGGAKPVATASITTPPPVRGRAGLRSPDGHVDNLAQADGLRRRGPATAQVAQQPDQNS